MANDYCTTTDLKEALVDSGLSSTDITSYDDILAACITRASRMIDTYTRRSPGAYAVSTDASETRYFTGSGKSEQWIDEMCAAPSAVGLSESGGVQSSDYTTIPSSDYFTYPDNTTYTAKPIYRLDFDTINGAYSTWYRYRKSVKVTGAFGYAYSGSTPDDIKTATIIQAGRLFKRGHQGFGDGVVASEMGTMTYTKNIDPEAAEIIAHYRRLAI